MAQKQGYRVRTSVFIPITDKSADATLNAITYAKKFESLPEGAPAGTVIEKCVIKHGFEKEDGAE